MLRADDKPKAVPCWCCGADSVSVIWELAMCQECTSAWWAAPGFTAGELGFEDLENQARKKTHQWARERRAQLNPIRKAANT